MRSFGETLKRIRTGFDYSQPEVVEKLQSLGIEATQQKVSRWENDRNSPTIMQFIGLCKIYGIKDVYKTFVNDNVFNPAYDLNDEGIQKLEEYRKLLIASGMYCDVIPANNIIRFPGRTAPLYSVGASAGTGQFLDSSDYEMIEVPDEVPLCANFALHVAGDSMEPNLHDGEIIWVRQQPTLENGEIGVFFLDGNAYVKELRHTSDGTFLVSHNQRYVPIRINEYSESRIYGKVVYPII